MAEPVSEDLKLAHGSGLVELFDFDLSMLGGPIYHFTPKPTGSLGYITFGGVQYFSFPFEFKSANGAEGTLPRMQLTVGAVQNLVFKAALVQYGSLLGMRMTKRVTYAKYLDGAANANSSMHSTPELWICKKLLEQGKESVSFEMALPIDAPNIVFPPGQCLKVASANPYDVYCPGLTRV